MQPRSVPVHGLECADGLVTEEWNGVTGQTNVSGKASGEMTFSDTNATSAVRACRVWVEVPGPVHDPARLILSRRD